MRRLKKALLLTTVMLAGLLLLVALALGFVQTRPGKVWLARTVAQLLSDDDEQVTIVGLAGFVPFDMKAREIALSDAQGKRVIVSDAEIAITPLAILSRRLVLRLEADSVEVTRSASQSGGGSSL